MRPSPALLVATALVATLWGPLAGSAAAAELDTIGGGAVREASFHYDVRIDGVVATVTAQQTLLNEGTGEAVARYAFALPPDAAIVGLSVAPPGGGAHAGAPVDAVGAITAAADRDTIAVAPDLGLVRRVGDLGGDVAYELRVWPVGGREVTTVELTWVAPLAYVDGRLVLRLPGRGGAPALASETGSVRVAPPAGVKEVRDLHAGGALLAAKPGAKTWRFTSARTDVTIEVTPRLTRPIATIATTALDGDTGAVAIAVLRPRADAAPRRFARALFVVDVSASVAPDAAARDALAAVVDGIAGGLREGVSAQAIVFDRAATRVLDDWTEVTATSRAAIGKAIRGAGGRAGTDLLGALALARPLVAGGDGDTLVVVVTDGILPSDHDAGALATALAGDPDAVTVSAVLVAADDAALPDPRDGALAELASRHGGHVVALRRRDAAARATTLANDVGAAASWYVQTLEVGGAEASLALPAAIPAGGGFVAFGWYRGALARAPELQTSGPTLALTRGKGTAGAIPRVAGLAAASGREPLLPPGAVGTGGEARAFATRERTIGVVGAWTALVAVDRGDELAAARLDLAARGGTFARIPPPPEETIVVTPPVVEQIVDAGARYRMDTAARIRVDLLGPQLAPAARRCFHAALGKGGAARGKVALDVEIARGEVIAVRTASVTASVELQACLREAAYGMTVPSYTLADDPDAIHLIRYPIEFVAAKDTSPRIAVGDGDGADPIDLDWLNTDDPLGGLEQAP